MPEVDEEFVAAEAARIRQVDRWPMYPLLPVKERVWPLGRIGVLAAHDLTTVVLTPETIWGLSTGKIGDVLAGHERLEFDSVEAMVRAGWVGD